MGIISDTEYFEGVVFVIVVLVIYLIYLRGVRRAINENKVRPAGLFDYYANLRYYRRDPHDQGYREYKRQTLFNSKPPNNEQSRDSYRWEQHKNDEFRDEFEDWDDEEDEDDEDWDWDDEEDEDEDEDDDDEEEEEDDENDYEDEDDVNISLLGLLLGNHTTDTEEDEEEEKARKRREDH